MPQVVPVQIDLCELLAIDPSARPCSCRLDAVSEQYDRLPSGADGALILTRRRAEGVPVGAQESTPFEELREPALGLERNSPRLRILGVLCRDTNLVRVPDDVTVLDLQHLAEPAAGFERADDSIPHRGTSEAMLDAVELVGGGKQPLFFVVPNAAITFRLTLGLDLDAEAVERRRREDRRRATAAPVDRVSQNGKRAIDGGRRFCLAV